ncbi:hypothetical protein BH11MYX1_BH11MYX1_48290 [soil metagenome]
MMRHSSGILGAVACALSFVVACSFGGSSDNHPSPDAATSGGHCGDGTCAANEVNSCPADCGQGSNAGSGSGSGSGTATCNNNGTCDAGETTANCAGDCPAANSACPTDVTQCAICAISGTSCPTGLDMTSCLACLVPGGGGGSGLGSGLDILCDGGAANGSCNPATETAATCSDCP